MDMSLTSCQTQRSWVQLLTGPSRHGSNKQSDSSLVRLVLCLAQVSISLVGR